MYTRTQVQVCTGKSNFYILYTYTCTTGTQVHVPVLPVYTCTCTYIHIHVHTHAVPHTCTNVPNENLITCRHRDAHQEAFWGTHVKNPNIRKIF